MLVVHAPTMFKAVATMQHAVIHLQCMHQRQSGFKALQRASLMTHAIS